MSVSHRATHEGIVFAAADLRLLVEDDELAKDRTLDEYREMLVNYLTEFGRQHQDCDGGPDCELAKRLSLGEPPTPRHPPLPWPSERVTIRRRN